MFFTGVNLVVVLIAAVVSMVIGYLWYSPIGFGKVWLKALGITPDHAKQKSMCKRPLYSFLLTLVMSYTVAVIINSTFTRDISSAIVTGLVLAIGLLAAMRLNDKVFTPTPWAIFLISAGYYTVSIVIMTVIIAIFS